MKNNFVVFYCEKGGKWWTMRGKFCSPDFSSVIDSLGFTPKKIKFKRRKGSGKNMRFESIRFTHGKFDYSIVNWGLEEPTYG